ncbi:2-oxoglutarate dehydrogenase E1 component [Gammaproteobacteria bacterium]|nr:2-oxoglutarate dehydrogenase E1 component [Gammaproteobacteria bacterium]
MKGYRYYLQSELYSPNSMAYVEHCYEEVIDGITNALAAEFDTNGPTTQHRKICHSLLEKTALSVSESSADILINYYRRNGHYMVELGLFEDQRMKPPMPKLDGLLMGEFAGKQQQLTVKSWHEHLSKTYASQIGYEFMYCHEEEREWLCQAIEKVQYPVGPEELKKAFADITRAVKLEGFLGLSFVGQKRFSLEGCEGLVPLLESIIANQLSAGFDDVVIGMPHRGRINTLINVMGLPLKTIYEKFDGSYIPQSYSGDVKYHLGHSVDRILGGQHVHIALGYNPSHLEAINSVVMGNVRARIDSAASSSYAIIVHGDAAIAGQGVVMETLTMSGVKAYDIGGSFHIVVNNQLGFTTNPSDSRTTTYCTDIAKMIAAPVFHVRADDLKSLIQVVKIAVHYRAAFKKDVFIDLVGYRKHGHNEADEPRATQPLMYQNIAKREKILDTASKQLQEHEVPSQFIEETLAEIESRVKEQTSLVDCLAGKNSSRELAWGYYQSSDWAEKIPEVAFEDLKHAAALVSHVPKDFEIQRQVKKLIENRQKMAVEKMPLNWGMAELVAYQYLIGLGHPIRLVGQDCVRGTFAHRHAIIFDQKTGQAYCCIQDQKDVPFYNYNSVLSEYAALGYEYGYAETDPKSLVIFEAQFGDFINGAQIIIDQFISSGYQKWQRCCGLVMLLPHGYEGQGPEHSSARLERFLQLASEDSMQICVPTTAKQIFSLLVRQALRPYRRPLIVMSPKSLLRLDAAASELVDLLEPFSVVIDDQSEHEPNEIILCSGKVYYDIKAYAKAHELQAHCIRLEQLYPFPAKALKAVLAQYPVTRIKWCQEEPENQGAWQGIRDHISEILDDHVSLSVCARPHSASPAVGYMSVHQAQQEALMQKIFLEDKS